MQFWLANISNLQKRKILEGSSSSRIAYSDVSGSGYGGYCVELDGIISHGQWNDHDSIKSSTLRELWAVSLVLNSFIPYLKNNRIKWFTDSHNTEVIISKGSMNFYVQILAYDIYKTCFRYSIHLDIQWIPRYSYQLADLISKFKDYDDWGISVEVFAHIDSVLGPHSIDRFATWYNKKCVRFNSRFCNPDSEAIDTLTVNWSGEINWVVPPLIARTLGHLQRCICKGTLVVPEWKSSFFWPLLINNGRYISQIKSFIYLPRGKNAYVASRIPGGLFGVKDPNFNMLAMFIDFSIT